MCEPVSIAMAAMSVGSAVMQHKQASMQAKMQTQMHKANQANAHSAMLESLGTNQIRQGQEVQSASEQITQRYREAQMARGTSNAAAADSGVTGFSVDRIVSSIMGDAARDTSTIKQNRDWTLDQLNREQLGHISTAQSRKNSTTPGVQPNKWATAFQIGAGAVNSYSGYTQRTGNTPVEDWWANRKATGTT